jgi:uncharacterized protein with PQ loop repeat
MLTITEVAGFAGAGLAGAAYVPQISHLIRARCSAGISRLAFGVWLLASLLVAARAIAIHAGVFILLGGIQVVATTLIMFYAARYKDTRCPIHLPHQPGAKIATGTAPGETNLVSGVRPAAQLLNQPHPPGAVGHCAPTSLACTPHSDVLPAPCGREPDVQVFRSWPRLRIAVAVHCADVARPAGAGPCTEISIPRT